LEKVHKWGSVGLSVRQDFEEKTPISIVKFISDAAGFLQMRRWKMYEYNSGRRQGGEPLWDTEGAGLPLSVC